MATEAEQLDEMFPEGALVQLWREGATNPVSHHVAALHPVADGVLFWDTEVGNTYEAAVSSLETVQTEPCLVVKAKAPDGSWLIVSANVGKAQRKLNVEMRASQRSLVSVQ